MYYTDEPANPYRVRGSIVGREAEFISKLVASGGHSVIKEIEGEFALAVIDHAYGTTIAFRDAFGGYPSYFYQDDHQVQWRFILKRFKVARLLRRSIL